MLGLQRSERTQADAASYERVYIRMTTFPGSSHLLKGAIVNVDPANPLAGVIVFQYNPETMTCWLDARSTGGEEGDTAEVFRLTGPPQETITLTVEVDAADHWRKGTGAVCGTRVLTGSAIGPGSDYLGNLG